MKIETKNLIVLGVTSLIITSCISSNDLDNKTDSSDNKAESKIEKIDSPPIKLNRDEIISIIDSAYLELNTLKLTDELEDHCNWLREYSNEVSTKISRFYQHELKFFEIISFTKMNKNEYVLYYQGNCRILNKEKVSESVKNKLNKINACSNPNDINRIKSNSFRNMTSKYQPDFKEVPSLIEVWYN